MNVKDIAILVVIVSIISAGGIGGIVIAVIRFSSEFIADRLSKKYENKLEMALEKYRTELSKKEYVSKTRFDTEFAIYRELTATFSQMITDISLLIPAGYTEVPADEKAREELDQKHYIEANNSVVKHRMRCILMRHLSPKSFAIHFRSS